MDCDVGGKIHGCDNPGSMVEAFEFITRHGLASEYKYPYEGKNGQCNTKKKLHPKAKIMGYESVPINNETALLLAVAHQPVSVVVSSSSYVFKYYREGVLTGECDGSELNHELTVVGYGETKEGIKYWIAKNSWDRVWGEQGYIRIQRDRGLCGIGKHASYPIA